MAQIHPYIHLNPESALEFYYKHKNLQNEARTQFSIFKRQEYFSM